MNWKQRYESYEVEERVILAISLLTIICVLPATLYRLYTNDLFIALFDVLIIFVCSLITVTTYFRKYVQAMRYLLAGLICAGLITTCYLQGISQIFWVYPGLVALFYLQQPRKALITSALVACIIVPSLLAESKPLELASLYITLFATVLFVYIFSREMQLRQKHLSNLAEIDFLTGVGNRRAFNNACHQMMLEAQYESQPLSIVMLDLDNFKALNDKYGHDVGDDALAFVSKIIKSRLRRNDCLFRLGGEEFAILVSDSYVNDAHRLCEDLRLTLATTEQENIPKVTVSFGVAQLNRGEKLSEWIRRADQAMYLAKRNGKDQVYLAA